MTDFRAQLGEWKAKKVIADFHEQHGGGDGQKKYLRKPPSAKLLDAIAASMNAQRRKS